MRQPPKPKRWQFTATQAEDIEEEKNAETTNILQEDEDGRNNPEINKESYPHHLQNNENLIEDATNPNARNPQQQYENPRQENGGSKRAYSTTSSDSEKDIMAATNEAQMIIVTTPPNNEGWWKVEKKKGRKAQIDS